MKLTKKILGIFLSLVIVLAMTATAFAAETYSITINNDAENHTYEAYQIFSGSLHEGVLSNVVWGTGVSAEGKAALGDASVKAESLTEENAPAFAKEVAEYLSDPAATTSTMTEGKYVIDGLSAGYYLVKDMDNTLTGKDDAYTSYILKVVNNVTTSPKAAKPTSYKKVKDINDSTETTKSNWQDSADHDIGDMIDYQLTGTVAANYDSYETYYYAFHDVECEGLTFDADSVKVYVDGTEITGNYEVVTEGLTDGCTFEVVFKDLKKISEVKANSVITVEYQSQLNDKAVLGSKGNPNEMYLEYSNNPNESGSGDSGEGGEEGDEDKPETGVTPVDKVIVFTYKTVVNKVDAEGKPLTGAEFTLEKFNKADNTWEAVEVVKNEEGTVFTFTGIDDGRYRVTETKTPEGYNSINPIYFTVTAEHEVLADDPELTSLSATHTDAEGANMTTGNVATFTAVLSEGSLSTDVVNQKGSTLPSTGGFGTYLIYTLGCLLVLAAVVAFFVKKRTSC